MKFKSRVPIVTLALCGALVVSLAFRSPQPAKADIAIAQQVVLKRDKGPFTMRYKDYNINQSGCANIKCNSRGKITFSVKLYQLKEREPRYKYFLVDVTGYTHNRRDFAGIHRGWADIRIATTKSVGVTTYSSGSRRSLDACRKVPIEITANMGPIGVGTTVGHFRRCKNSYMTRKVSGNGAKFHLSRLDYFRTFEAQKYIRIRKDQHRKFYVHVIVPRDKCNDDEIPDVCLSIQHNNVLRTFWIRA